MVIGLSSGDPDVIRGLLHPTGEFAARFMILAMMVTPLVVLLKQWRGPRWLMKRRRYLGVAAFGYAVVHTVLYLVDTGSVAISVAEVSKVYIWTGWLAFLIFVPLAVTSTDGWVRRLGRRWKLLQQFVYAAAILTLVHWAALHDWGGIAPALVHFGPLMVLQVLRVRAYLYRRNARRSVAF